MSADFIGCGDVENADTAARSAAIHKAMFIPVRAWISINGLGFTLGIREIARKAVCSKR
jgi:hypothetical protein